MEALLLLLLILVAVVVLPLLVLKLLLDLALWLLLLPFRILGALVAAGLGLLGVVATVLLCGAGLAAAAGFLLVGLVLLPLLPFLLIGGAVWLMMRRGRKRAPAQAAL